MRRNLTLLNWRVCKGIEAYVLLGNVYNHPRFNNGANVRTSIIETVVEEEDIFRVETCSGSHYILKKSDCASPAEIELLRLISK